MDFKTKRRTKRIAKMLFVLTYVMTGIFIIGFVLAITVAFKFKFTPMFFGIPIVIMIIWSVSILMYSAYEKKLRQYKFNIRHYRQSVAYHKIIDFIRSRDFKSAAYWYNNFIHDSEYRSFLFPFYINELLHSNNLADVENGEKLLSKQLEIWDPKKVWE
jgi:hypothetical protein